MNCKKCEGELLVKNTYSTKTCKFQRAKCPGCDAVYTIYIGILYEEPEKGQGASAMIKDINEGRKAVNLVVVDPTKKAAGF